MFLFTIRGRILCTALHTLLRERQTRNAAYISFVTFDFCFFFFPPVYPFYLDIIFFLLPDWYFYFFDEPPPIDVPKRRANRRRHCFSHFASTPPLVSVNCCTHTRINNRGVRRYVRPVRVVVVSHIRCSK